MSAWDVRLGRGRQEQVTGEVDQGAARARAVRRQAAGRADRLDAPAAQPYVHGPPVGEARARTAGAGAGSAGSANDDGDGGRGGGCGRLSGIALLGLGPRTEGAQHAETRSRRVIRA
ncbi:hypothetical protein GCM10019016_032740 [Streptomyces prasinosporus]|uniref:Uncharacterized protein n=1 Tax=Streptomyces prasinosporus TaxID=68256 RepID=A0ABP6TLP3_9ACTN